MTRLMKAVIVSVISVAAVSVSLDAFAQRSRGGGGGSGYHQGYRGGGGGHYHGYRGGHYRGHGHSHSSIGIGFAFGGPLWYSWPAYYPYYYPSYYYPPYYYPYSAGVSVPAPEYIERDRAAVAESPYWYYCRESDTYYPYVKQCSGSWERVPAQPAR